MDYIFTEKKPLPKWITYIQHFFWKIFGHCPRHGTWFTYPYRFRQHTCYQNEEDNWCYGCKHCEKETAEHWEEMWADYYGSIL